MILVTGASGFLGQAVVEVLGQGRRPLVLLSRNELATHGFDSDERRAIQADLLKEGSWSQELPTRVSVIHLAGGSPSSPEKDATNNVVMMRSLLDALASVEVDRFVFVSASNAQEGSSSPWLRAKAEAEQLLRDSGLDHTILRSGPVFGEDDPFLNATALAIKNDAVLRIPLLCNGTLRPISVKDVAVAVVTALDHYRMVGECLDIGGAKMFSLQQLLEVIASRVSRTLQLKRGPLGGTALQKALQQTGLPVHESCSWVRWFSIAEAPDVADFERILPISKVELEEEIRQFPWGAPPPRPGEPLPVMQQDQSWIPPFIPAPHLLDEGETMEDIRRYGRVDPFGRPEQPDKSDDVS